MGDKANVKLNYGGDHAPVYIYTHWGASNLPGLLARSLFRGESRWDDPDYLARIIASDIFTDADIASTTGAGLSPWPCESTHFEVDFARQQVTDLRDGEPGKVLTFAEFATLVPKR